MKVLVTGGSGYLGRSIVHALARHGHEPVAFARRATSAGLPGKAIDGDVRDCRAVQKAIRGMDAVCHSAALVSLWRRRPRDFDEVNVDGLKAVLNACESEGIARIACTSSFLALPPRGAAAPLEANDYQRTKVRAREVVRQAVMRGAPIVTLYPGVIYGPGPPTEGNLIGRMVRDHMEGGLPGLIGASRVWSYVFIEDAALGHVRALEAGAAGDEFVLGGENAAQMRVFEIIRDRTGRPLPRRIPYAAATAVAVVEEARARITGRPPVLTRGAVAIFRHDWALDSGLSAARLGYRPRSLVSGLEALLPPQR